LRQINIAGAWLRRMTFPAGINPDHVPGRSGIRQSRKAVMNRTVLQVIAMLMVTAAISFTAAEWRWEPANRINFASLMG
jgi:hypothetical protein